MEKAKLFRNGSSQAVRLPKEFRISGNEVKIYKKGKQIIIEPLEMTWDAFFESLSDFPEDFLQEGRNQPAAQTREEVRGLKRIRISGDHFTP
jgi:antitoxin VapB